MMKNSLGWSIDDVVINGNGMGKPTGILQSGARINYTRATANQVSLADMAGMYGRLLPSSANKAVWLMSAQAFGYCLTLTTAAGQLLMSGAPGAAAGIPYTIFGRPVRITEKCAALGSEGDVILADLSYYGLAERETGRFEMTNAAQWTNDVIDVRLIHRLDGQPLISTPVKPKNGLTLSPFVVLK
jgi:HK97 family phage major capsid protein